MAGKPPQGQPPAGTSAEFRYAPGHNAQNTPGPAIDQRTFGSPPPHPAAPPRRILDARAAPPGVAQPMQQPMAQPGMTPPGMTPPGMTPPGMTPQVHAMQPPYTGYGPPGGYASSYQGYGANPYFGASMGKFGINQMQGQGMAGQSMQPMQSPAMMGQPQQLAQQPYAQAYQQAQPQGVQQMQQMAQPQMPQQQYQQPTPGNTQPIPHQSSWGGSMGTPPVGHGPSNAPYAPPPGYHPETQYGQPGFGAQYTGQQPVNAGTAGTFSQPWYQQMQQQSPAYGHI